MIYNISMDLIPLVFVIKQKFAKMVFFDNTLVTTEELSASDAAALEAMACCWENEPVTYGADWLGCI